MSRTSPMQSGYMKSSMPRMRGVITMACLSLCVFCQDVLQHKFSPSFLLFGPKHRVSWHTDANKRKLSVKEEKSPTFQDKLKACRQFCHFLHFNGNIYWRLLNNSSCHSYRGVKDHCTVSFFTVFLTVFTSSISADHTHWRSISF